MTGTNLSNLSTRIEKTIEIYIVKDNKYLSDFSSHGDDLAGITTDIDRLIPKYATTKLLESLGDTGFNCWTRIITLDIKPITQLRKICYKNTKNDNETSYSKNNSINL